MPANRLCVTKIAHLGARDFGIVRPLELECISLVMIVEFKSPQASRKIDAQIQHWVAEFPLKLKIAMVCLSRDCQLVNHDRC